MQHLDALKRARSLLRRPEGPDDEPQLHSPDLMEQSPDLAKETFYRNASGWAAAGQPSD